MSEFRVQVVEIGKVGKHPNADTLSITQVFGYPVIFRTGDYNPGDKAVYIPVDAIVPLEDPRWEFLQGHTRIKAKRLRGIFSMGLLTPSLAEWEVGQYVQEELNITKYEPAILATTGSNESCPFDFPIYTDIEGYRRHPDIFKEGEIVLLTEKIHGANGRYVWRDGRLWVGSHKCIKKEDDTNLWWLVAKQYDLAEKLKQFPDIVVFGEVYGYVQDLKYGMNKGEYQFAAFDAMDLKSHRYFDAIEFTDFMEVLKLPIVPVLHLGPWSEDLIEKHSNGNSTIAKHVREGFVARPMKERWDETLGRVVLKYIGEQYLLRKEEL